MRAPSATLQRPSPQSGFTLVEVLVALVVMSVMALMAWQGVDGIVRTRDASQQRLDQTLRMGTVISQWEQDLASIQDTPSVPALTCDGASVRITRRTEGGVQVVDWSLHPATNGSVWTRWAGPAVTTSGALQESWMRTQQFQGGEPGQLNALTGISQWQVYFFQGNAWANCQSTGNQQVISFGASATPQAASSAPGTASSAASAASSAPVAAPVIRQALPSGVRLVLNFGPGSGLDGSLVRDTLIAP
jgi:general secretion pathway protein J